MCIVCLPIKYIRAHYLFILIIHWGLPCAQHICKCWGNSGVQASKILSQCEACITDNKQVNMPLIQFSESKERRKNKTTRWDDEWLAGSYSRFQSRRQSLLSYSLKWNDGNTLSKEVNVLRLCAQVAIGTQRKNVLYNFERPGKSLPGTVRVMERNG